MPLGGKWSDFVSGYRWAVWRRDPVTASVLWGGNQRDWRKSGVATDLFA